MRVLLLLSGILLTSAVAQSQHASYRDSVEVHRTDTIYFEFGSEKIDAEALEKIYQMATDRPGALELYLEGHTDAVGTNDANELLAMRRSQAALEAFVDAGWPLEAVELRHFGERSLAIPTPSRERLNRRVLLRSGLPRRYVRLEGIVRGEDGTPLPGGAIAHGTYLQDTVTANQEGIFELWIPLNDSIRLDVFARQHFIETEKLIVKAEDPPPPRLEVTLQAATSGERLDIENLYFVGNRTVFLPGADIALERIYHFMAYNPEIKIELAGHVNHVGEPQPPGTHLHGLAGARAKIVYKYLVGRGISPKRMRFRSYSNYEMINPEAVTEEERRANRRVEIRVL